MHVSGEKNRTKNNNQLSSRWDLPPPDTHMVSADLELLKVSGDLGVAKRIEGEEGWAWEAAGSSGAAAGAGSVAAPMWTTGKLESPQAGSSHTFYQQWKKQNLTGKSLESPVLWRQRSTCPRCL